MLTSHSSSLSLHNSWNMLHQHTLNPSKFGNMKINNNNSVKVNKGSTIWKWPHHQKSTSLWNLHKSCATFPWNFTQNFLQCTFDVLLFESCLLTLIFQLTRAQAPAKTSLMKHQKIVSVKPLSYNVCSWLPLPYFNLNSNNTSKSDQLSCKRLLSYNRPFNLVYFL